MPRYRSRKLPFWSRVLKQEEGCWIWLGKGNAFGYGKGTAEGKQDAAHRVAWRLTYGEIPDGLFVLHKCDNPECVRPDHLFLGTQKDNMHDGFRKGRLRPFGNRQLTPASVMAIREYAASGKSIDDLSRMFNRSITSIRRIVSRQTYKMIGDAPMITLTHETELAALAGRVAYLADPHGDLIAAGTLQACCDAGRPFWRIVPRDPSSPNYAFELGDVADLAGNVIELRRAAP